MAKPPPPKQGFTVKGFDFNHYQRTEAYVKAVDGLYDQAVNEFAAMGSRLNINPDKPFSFNDYPTTRGKADKILSTLAGKMQAVIKEATTEEWNFACKKNDAFLASIFNTSKIPSEMLSKWSDRNLTALQTFQNRKVNGLGLSDRIWNYTGQLKTQMELGIDVGMGKGTSAQSLSKELKQFLVDPDKLFRRVRDKRGQLQLSKNAAAFHPGAGKYRSSSKNAARLTRSEINMAYREADQLRWSKLDFVVGFEVKLSANHPLPDICDSCKGKYPKSFVFKGWHPQCRCYVVSVLMDPDEFDNHALGKLKQAVNGTEYTKQASRNAVTDVPQGFKDWTEANKEASKGWKSQPYFIKDNFKGGNISGGLSLAKQEIVKPTPANIAKPPIEVVPVIPQAQGNEFVPAQSVKEARESSQSIIESNSTIRIKSVSYRSDMSLDRINNANKQLHGLFNEYDVAKVYNDKTLVALKFNSGGSYYGRVVGMNDNTMLKEINFGDRFDRNRVSFASKYRPKSKVDAGNVEISTLTHEFAHILTVDRQQARSYIDDRLTNFMPELRSIKSKYTRELNLALKAGKQSEFADMYLGDYASYNINEFMAEAFTEYKLSSNPSKYAKEVGELIDRTFKKKGVVK